VIVLESSRKRESIYVRLKGAYQTVCLQFRLWKESLLRYDKRSVVLSHPDWPLITRTHRLMRRRLGIIDFSLRRKKRIREESSNETVVLAPLNVQTLYLLRY